MGATLYGIRLSHPAIATKLALKHKGIDYELVQLPAGLHPLIVRTLGFKRGTVPALKIDGANVQGSIEINRYLEEHHPGTSLYPGDEGQAKRIRTEEEWGERVLQDLPRRIFRWAAKGNREVRKRIAVIDGFPAPGAVAITSKPMAAGMAKKAGVSDQQVREDVQSLPAHMDKVEALLEEGVLGGPQPNAADFQIAASVRTLASFDDLRELIDSRPAGAYARNIVPEVAGQVPRVLPPEWIPAS